MWHFSWCEYILTWCCLSFFCLKCFSRNDVCPAEISGLAVVPRRPSAVRGLEACFNGTCNRVSGGRWVIGYLWAGCFVDHSEYTLPSSAGCCKGSWHIDIIVKSFILLVKGNCACMCTSTRAKHACRACTQHLWGCGYLVLFTQEISSGYALPLSLFTRAFPATLYLKYVYWFSSCCTSVDFIWLWLYWYRLM